MEIEVRRSVDPAEWDRLVREDAKATFFHTRAWVDLLSRTIPGMSPRYLTLRDGGLLVGGIPAVIVSRPPFATLASMPYGTFGGPVLSPDAGPGAARRLVEAFAGVARRALTAAAHLVDFPGRAAEPPPGFVAVREEAQIVRLTRSAEEIERAFKPSVRNKVRKAEKAGVTVRRAEGERDFLEYAGLLAECSERWGTRTEFGPRFFSELSRLDRDAVQMWLAEHEGRIVGGDLNFVLHGMIVNWGNVSSGSAKHLAPNNILHARAIEEGRRAGVSIFNLGASAGIEGVDAFKASFGTERAPYRRFASEKPWYRALKRIRPRRGGGDA